MRPGTEMRVLRRRAVRHSWLLRATIAAPRPGWHERATCKGQPLRAVTPAICTTCPVRLDCLAAALVEEADAPESHDCRGGVPAAHRTQFLRAQRALIDQSEVEAVAALPAAVAAIDHGTRSGYRAELDLGVTTCHACRAAHTERVMLNKRLRRERRMQPLALAESVTS